MSSLFRSIHSMLELCTKGLCSIAKVVTVVSLAILVVDLGAGSIMRYTIKFVPAWYEELAKFFLIWLAFAGSIVAMEKGDHVAIDLFPSWMNRQVKIILYIIAQCLILVAACMVCRYGWRFAQGGWLGVFPSMDFVHLFYGYVSLPLGFFGIALIAVRNIAGLLADLFSPTEKAAA